MGVMTTREKFDRLVDQLSEPSLKAEYARLLREREIDRQVVESIAANSATSGVIPARASPP